MSTEERWINQQRRAFTGWCNGFLLERNMSIKRFEDDLPDGVMLWNLMEIISGKRLPRLESKTPKTRFQKVGNLNIVFKFLEQEKLYLVNIGADDLYNGNTKLILGLIWTLILRYQIQKGSYDTGGKAKSELLEWVNCIIAPRKVNDFNKSFQDGIAFAALVDYFVNKTFDLDSLSPSDAVNTMTKAFATARDQLKIPELLDPQMVATSPDDLSIMTYVSYFRNLQQMAQADPEETEATGSGLRVAYVDDEADFLVTTKNKNGEKLKNGGKKITATFKVEDGSEVPVKIVDNKDGTYTGGYTPEKVVNGVLSIHLEGKPIRSSPFKVTVFPPKIKPDPSKTTAAGPGLENPTEDAETGFTIFSKDKNGDAVPNGGFPFVVHIQHKSATEPTPSKVIDKNDGTYLVLYTPTQPGDYDVQVTLNGKPISGSTFKVPVKALADIPDPSKCQAFGRGLKKGVVNKKAYFFIVARNREGRRLFNGGAKFDVQVSSGNSNVEATIRDNNKGKYYVSYTPKETGKHTIQVRLQGTAINGSPFYPRIKAAYDEEDKNDAATKHCTAVGRGLTYAQVNKKGTFYIISRDRKGKRVKTGGEFFDVEINGKEADVHADVHDLENGVYRVTYVPAVLGKYKVQANLKAKAVKGTPSDLVVGEEEFKGPIAKHTTASGAGVRNPKVDEDNRIDVLTCDSNEKPFHEGGDYVDVFLQHPNGNLEPLEVKDNGDGTYETSYNPKVNGQYKVHVTLNEEPIQGSPFVVRTSPLVDASLSTATGPGVDGKPSKPLAGEETHFKIQAKDKDGKDVKLGGNDVKVAISGPESPQAKVKDNGNGTYDVTYTPTQPGDYVIDVQLEGKPVKDAPFTLEILPSLDPTQCEAEGDGLKKARVGQPAHFKIITKDKNGKKVPLGGHRFDVSLNGPSDLEKIPVKDNGDGTYDVEYTPTKKGDHKLFVKVLEKDIHHSPFGVQVKPAVDNSKIVAEGKGLSKAKTTQANKFKVICKDEEGKPTTDEEFEMKLVNKATGEQVEVKKGEVKDGNYHFEYQPSKAGDYQLEILHENSPIPKSPFQISCKKGAKPEKSTVAKWAFTITAKTEDNEPEEEGDEEFLVDIQGPAKVTPKVKPKGKGKYYVSYTLPESGEYKIHISLGGKPIKGSPYTQFM